MSKKKRAFAVICLDSWPFDNARKKGKLDERQRELVIHELVHVMQKQWRNGKDFDNGTPTWLIESDANYIAHTSRIDSNRTRDSELARMARNSDTSIPIRNIKDKSSFARYRPYSYSNTEQATLWRVERFGMEAIKRFWVETGKGASNNAAFERAFGMSVNEFYKRFEYM